MRFGAKALVRLGLGAHLVQGEDQSDPLRIGREAVRASMVKPRQGSLHHGGFHLGQSRSPFRAINH
jgi:hypothetical protein